MQERCRSEWERDSDRRITKTQGERQAKAPGETVSSPCSALPFWRGMWMPRGLRKDLGCGEPGSCGPSSLALEP